jgi:hypothetical protein
MCCLPCFVLLVLLVAAAKIFFEEQALVAGTKQCWQADKAVGPGCIVVPATSAFCSKLIFCQLIYLEQSTFL